MSEKLTNSQLVRQVARRINRKSILLVKTCDLRRQAKLVSSISNDAVLLEMLLNHIDHTQRFRKKEEKE